MAESPSDRLRAAREAAGFKTAADFAKAHHLTESTYRSADNGTRGLRLAAAKQYAPLLGVTWQWLMDGGPGGPGTSAPILSGARRQDALPMMNPSQQGTGDRIKVLGMAECGPDGWSLWNGEVIDMVARPPVLAGAPNGFAVYVVGTSMQNRYHPGELVFIHPGRPVTPGSYVLVQMHPPAGESVPRAFLKRLVKRTGDKVIFEQFEPKKTFTLKAGEILSMHRVVGSSEA